MERAIELRAHGGSSWSWNRIRNSSHSIVCHCSSRQEAAQSARTCFSRVRCDVILGFVKTSGCQARAVEVEATAARVA